MSTYTFPAPWADLQGSLSARFEVMNYLSMVSRWNNEDSPVQEQQSGDIITFFFDDLGLERGADGLVNLILFSDEAEAIENFFTEFRRFIDGFDNSLIELDDLHKADAPDGVVNCARLALEKMETRGKPHL